MYKVPSMEPFKTLVGHADRVFALRWLSTTCLVTGVCSGAPRWCHFVVSFGLSEKSAFFVPHES